jgi:hypothetical protein
MKKDQVFRSTVSFFSLIDSIRSACVISQAERDSQDRGLSAPRAKEIASPLTQVDPRKHLVTRQPRCPTATDQTHAGAHP